MDYERAKALSSAFDKLTEKVFRKEEELRKRELSSGTSHDVRKMNRLREEIESLNRRIGTTLRLLEKS